MPIPRGIWSPAVPERIFVFGSRQAGRTWFLWFIGHFNTDGIFGPGNLGDGNLTVAAPCMPRNCCPGWDFETDGYSWVWWKLGHMTMETTRSGQGRNLPAGKPTSCILRPPSTRKPSTIPSRWFTRRRDRGHPGDRLGGGRLTTRFAKPGVERSFESVCKIGGGHGHQGSAPGSNSSIRRCLRLTRAAASAARKGVYQDSLVAGKPITCNSGRGWGGEAPR